jgi:hypothetical protein
VAEVLEGKRPSVVAGLGECEKVGGERLLVRAKVADGKRPFSAKLSRNSQRRSQFSQSASAQSINSFIQASRQRRWSGVPPNI